MSTLSNSDRSNAAHGSLPEALSDRIRLLADQFFDATVASRRKLHQNPELSFHEFETAAYVADELESYGYAVQRGIGKTGVVGDMQGSADGPVVLLRADIDALPISEQTQLPYASRNPGVMHACGHDVHTASLLGAARILADMRDELHGSVRLAFQPAEESVPGGALGMIEDGILDLGQGHLGLDGRQPDAVFGLHTWPPLAAGKVAVRSGVFMASNDEIVITVHGQGGHAAEPHRLSADPVFVSAQLIVALQSVVSRNCPPDVPSVLSFGSIVADGASNIIPERATIVGTLRCMGEAWRVEAKRRIRLIVENVAAGFGASATCEIISGYPLLKNDATMSSFVQQEAMDFLGRDSVEEAPLWFAAEDFAYYLQQIPGAFFLLGVNRPDVQVSGLHTSTYSPDESALRTATSFIARLALSYCRTSMREGRSNSAQLPYPLDKS